MKHKTDKYVRYVNIVNLVLLTKTSNVFNRSERIRSIGLFAFVRFHCKLDRTFNGNDIMKFTLERKTSFAVTLLGISDTSETILLFSFGFHRQLSTQKDEKCYNLSCAQIHRLLSFFSLLREVTEKGVSAKIVTVYFDERGLTNL